MISFLRKPWFLSVATAILLWLSWSPSGFAPLLLIAFIPLLLLEETVAIEKRKGNKIRLFKWNYLSFLIFNILTTWWIYFASDWGMLMAVLCNALFMSSVFQLFHLTRLRLGDTIGYLSLISYWIAFEYLHLNWDLSWPWLTLGNGFASLCDWIQWYEFTGVLGGTAWILVSNLLLFNLLIKSTAKFSYRKLAFWIWLLVIPIGISKFIAARYEEEKNPVDVVVVQPNIDPYNEKFSGMKPEEQLAKMLRIASTVIDTSIEYVVFPETALPDGIWESELSNHKHVQTIRSFMQPYPALNFITGLSSNRVYAPGDKVSATARKFPDGEEYYDSYNTAMQLDSSPYIQLHHKSKLVIGVEKLPFANTFGFMEKIAINLGGSSGSLGTQDSPTVFISHQGTKVAPVICYESIYGDYVTEYVRKGAQAIFILTNDGWWHDTPGYRQHCVYASLRAIETRRSIARSANTGISCFINQLGEISQPTQWWTDDAITATIQLNNKITFYVKHGDYLGVLAFLISLFIMVGYLLSFTLTKRKK